jgi:tetratricopeptide (TPR) repeat protein
MKKTQQIMITGFSIALVVTVAAAVIWYKMDQQEKMVQNQLALDQAITLYEQTQYPQALQKLATITPGAMQDWRIPFYQGAASIRLKDYEAAVIYLEQSKSLNNSETQTFYLLGVAYYKLGNLKLSEGYFAATLELNPDHEQARGLMGVMSDLQKLQEQPAEPPQDPAPTENP